MKKVIVDESKCIRCGACVGIAGEVFKFGQEGESVPKVDTVADDDKDAIMAMESCPTGAIRLEDVTENESEGCECEHCDCEECECEHCECGDECHCEHDDCEN